MSVRLEFDESVSEEVKEKFARGNRASAAVDPSNILAGDFIRLYSKDGGEEQTFRCQCRRHDIWPDEPTDEDDDLAGTSRTVFVLGIA